MTSIKHVVESNNTPSDSDVDRNASEAVDQAAAVIEQYVDVANKAPFHAISMDRLAWDLTLDDGYDPENAEHMENSMEIVKKLVKERCQNRLTKQGDQVLLDFEGELVGPYWLTRDFPSIMFCTLDPKDELLRMHAPDRNARMRGMAVYYDPALVGDRSYLDKRTEEWCDKPDAYDPDGYVAICRVFYGLPELKEAKRELQRAINTIVRTKLTDSAIEPDPIRTLDIEQDDRDTDRRSRKTL